MKHVSTILAVMLFVLLFGLISYINISETMDIASHLVFTLISAFLCIIGLGVLLKGDRSSNPSKFSQSIK